MRTKIAITTALVLMAAPAHAGLGSFIKNQIKKTLEALPDVQTQAKGDPPSAQTSSQSAPLVGPVEPKSDPSEKDRFVTRKDAHGHDYDAKTGLLICLAKPRNYKAGAYADSYSQTSIPDGHNPNLSCISADREFTKI